MNKTDSIFYYIGLYLKNPILIIELVLKTSLIVFTILLVTACSISVFVNPYLEPFDTIDINLMIFSATGHYPCTTLFL